MASSTTNSAPQDHDHHHLVRRSSSSGRRKAGGCDSKKNKNKNKAPRRGMGVAKLERLRLQDEQPPCLPLPFTYFPQLGPTPTANNGGFVTCFALHCNACHKNKKINDRRILALDFGDKQHIMNQQSGNYANKVEVVAVDKKGTCGSWEGENGGVLREYDFFPAAAKSEEGESGMMKQEEGFLGSSSSMPAASNCIDLSLKLSY